MKRSNEGYDRADEAHRVDYNAPLAGGILAAALIGLIAIAF